MSPLPGIEPSPFCLPGERHDRHQGIFNTPKSTNFTTDVLQLLETTYVELMWSFFFSVFRFVIEWNALGSQFMEVTRYSRNVHSYAMVGNKRPIIIKLIIYQVGGYSSLGEWERGSNDTEVVGSFTLVLYRSISLLGMVWGLEEATSYTYNS